MSGEKHFIIPIKYYVFTFVSLLVLTVVTVYTAEYIDLGAFNIVLAMFIALVKAILVLLFFMGLRWDSGINVAFLSFGILFFFLFLSFTFLDVATRSSIVEAEKELVDIETPVKFVESEIKEENSAPQEQ